MNSAPKSKRATPSAPASKARTTAATTSVQLPRMDIYTLLLWGAIGLYIVIFTFLAFDLHLNMRTHRSDLGQIAQAVWNSSQGRFVEMTDNGFVATRMTDHVEPILALISPVLWLWRDVRILLLLQVVLVAIGAWPLYLLALHRLDTLLTPAERVQIWQVEPLRQMTRPLALALALAYLLTPQLQSALLTEFHAVPLAVPLILWAFWAVDRGKLGQFTLATLLVALTKEEMALLAAGLALWAIWRNWLRRRTEGAAPIGAFWIPASLMAMSLLWFYLATFVIVPAHAGQVYDTEQSVYFERYGALGDSPVDIVKSFLTQPRLVWGIASEPARISYLWSLLLPFGLLTLAAPEILLLALPLLLANLFSAYPAQYYGEFHYSAPLVPYVAVGAAYGLARIWRWVGRRTVGSSASYQHMPAARTGTMIFVSLLTNARTALRPLIAALLVLWLLGCATVAYGEMGRGPWGGRYDPVLASATDRAHTQRLSQFVRQIPADAAVTATAAVHPHVSLRRYVYQFPLGLPELGYAGSATWALLDVTTNTDMAPGDLKGAVDAMLANEWGVVDGADGFLLLRRGETDKVIPNAFYDFARSDTVAALQFAEQQSTAQQTQLPTETQFVGIEIVDWPRWRQTKVRATWQVGANGAENFTPNLTLVTPDGEWLADLTTMAPPALVWYPPAQWQPGEQVVVTSLPLLLPTNWGAVTTNPVVDTFVDGLKGLIATDLQTQIFVGHVYRLHSSVSRLPFPPSAPPSPPFLPLSRTATEFRSQQATESTGDQRLTARAWISTREPAAGQSVQLWLRWRGETWPAGKTVFVHLRADGETIAQRDGLPRFYVYPSPETFFTNAPVVDDLRQLSLPADLLPGTALTLVIGLYDPVTGERVPLVENGEVIGEEWVVGQVEVASPPIPDQACAMLAQSCTAQ